MYTKFTDSIKLKNNTEYICVIEGYLGKLYYDILTWYEDDKIVGEYYFDEKGFYNYDSEYGYGRCDDVVAYKDIEPYVESNQSFIW